MHRDYSQDTYWINYQTWWIEYQKKLTHPQSQEVYSDCKNPQGCVYCGGYCPYTTTKSLDE